MKPARFSFARARSLAEASAALRAADGDGKAVAGCQSLGPMLNLRLVQPRLLVDITGIPELTKVDEDGDAVMVGACVTTAAIEDGRARLQNIPILARVAAGVAYRAVRNRGTIGGSLCHADPAGDWLPVLAALGAECILFDGSQTRRLPVEQFVTGVFETLLSPGELLQAIRIPRPARDARCAYYKVCRKAGEFALASAALVQDTGRNRFRAVLGATEGRPIVIDDARALFGGMLQAGRQPQLDEAAALGLLRGAGITASAKQRQHLTALARAAAQAVAS
jgi:carbon-monoxide dehydrogenase medium subunit